MEKDSNYTAESLAGQLSVTLANNQTLDDFCASKIPEYNRERLEAMAIRLFIGDETIITVFAVDKTRQENSSKHDGKIPVKKFKLEDVSLHELLPYCRGFNCTLSTGNFSLEDMEVTNK